MTAFIAPTRPLLQRLHHRTYVVSGTKFTTSSLFLLAILVVGPARGQEPYSVLPDWMPVAQDVNPVELEPQVVWDQMPGTGVPQPPMTDRLILLPDGLLYRSYLASPYESRLGAVWFKEESSNTWLWDVTLGARVGLLRYGTSSGFHAEGVQIDVEGAGIPRLNLDENWDVDSTDFRFGVPLTWASGQWQGKLAYYHMSSHLGDEYMVRNNTLDRINYVRDAIVLGTGYFLRPDVRLYGEFGYAFHTDGGARPWETQFGVEFAANEPTGLRGVPFLAVNGYLSETYDWGGTLTAQAGWQWVGDYTNNSLRVGFQYLNGYSPQRQFVFQHEEQYGLGIWYDF